MRIASSYDERQTQVNSKCGKGRHDMNTWGRDGTIASCTLCHAEIFPFSACVISFWQDPSPWCSMPLNSLKASQQDSKGEMREYWSGYRFHCSLLVCLCRISYGLHERQIKGLISRQPGPCVMENLCLLCLIKCANNSDLCSRELVQLALKCPSLETKQNWYDTSSAFLLGFQRWIDIYGK